MTAIAPGTISPRRPVPEDIARPEYVDQPAPAPYDGPEVKDADTIDRMRVAGRLAAQALQLVGKHVSPGVTTDELDRIAFANLSPELLEAFPADPDVTGRPSRPEYVRMC